MKLYKITIVVAVAAILVGCEKETTLKESVFVPDETNSGLPAYSEWGFNTFGAFIDRNIFLFSYSEIPLKIIIENDTTQFLFQGHTGGGYYEDNSLSLKIYFAELNLSEYGDLASFHNTEFILTSDNCRIELIENNQTKHPDIIIGSFVFNRVQNLYVDKRPEQIIISGYFSFNLLIDKVPVSISDGRYDIGIAEYNFFNLDTY
jgi:hypothetical protein